MAESRTGEQFVAPGGEGGPAASRACSFPQPAGLDLGPGGPEVVPDRDLYWMLFTRRTRIQEGGALRQLFEVLPDRWPEGGHQMGYIPLPRTW